MALLFRQTRLDCDVMKWCVVNDDELIFLVLSGNGNIGNPKINSGGSKVT